MSTLNIGPPNEHTFTADDLLYHDSDDTSKSSTTTRASSSSSSLLSYSEKIGGVEDHDLECPYVLGLAFTVTSHEPSDPFGVEYTTDYPDRTLNTDAMSQSELCFSHDPLSGRNTFNRSKALTITSIIRTGVNEGPQVVAVNHDLVAKIYDPLYYNSGDGVDVIAGADRAYSCETAAYSHLQKFLEISDLVPKFHGSWTMEVQSKSFKTRLPASRARTVRLILIELLQGRCMLDIDPKALSDHVRSNILKQCIDAEIRLVHTGLLHGDFVPRNIVFLGSNYTTPGIQVKIIDFGSSEILAHPSYKDQQFAEDMLRFRQKWAPKLISPMKRWFGQLDEFGDLGWCPEEPCEAMKWLWKMFGNDDRYIAVKWDPEHRRAPPRYVDDKGETDDSDYD